MRPISEAQARAWTLPVSNFLDFAAGDIRGEGLLAPIGPDGLVNPIARFISPLWVAESSRQIVGLRAADANDNVKAEPF